MSNVPETEFYQVMAEESTYGVAPASITTILGRLKSTNSRIANNNQGFGGISNGLNDAQLNPTSLQETSISQTFDLINGYFLKLLLGTMTGSGTVGDSYNYACANTIPSITIEDAYNLTTDEVIRFLGCYPKKAVIKASIGQLATVTIDWESSNSTSGHTYQTITPISGNAYSFIEGVFEKPSTTSLTEIQEFTLNIDFTVKRNGGIGSTTSVIKVHKRKFSGSFKRLLNDSTSMTEARTNADIATMLLNFTSGDKYLKILIENITTDYDRNTEEEKSTEETVTFQALTVSATEVI